jgi:hypothetical protein
MKYRILALAAAVCFSRPASADLFGGDVVVLTQILANAMQQLTQLRSILNAGQENFELVKEINRGINDSLKMLSEIHPNLDPGIYKDWKNVSKALHDLEAIYGEVSASPESKVQRDLDHGIAEAVTFNNSYYDYSAQLDQVAERIKAASHDVSPGGAQKLTAQALGLILQALNQNLRAQATSLKLQAQGLAVENRRNKEDTRHLLDSAKGLKSAMQNERVEFNVPRFK